MLGKKSGAVVLLVLSDEAENHLAIPSAAVGYLVFLKITVYYSGLVVGKKTDNAFLSLNGSLFCSFSQVCFHINAKIVFFVSTKLIFLKIFNIFAYIMAEHNRIGNEGEDAAVEYLVRQGYRILHRNWRYRHYELDVVAYDSEEKKLVVVEVKTRSTIDFGNPEDAVTEGKIRRIVSATDAYINEFEVDDDVRFDVVSVVRTDDGWKLNHIKDAFFPPLWE